MTNSPQPPPGYGPPPGYQGWGPPPKRTNGFAIASLVLSLLWIWGVGSILALVFGQIARKQIAERHEDGGGMATAGLVLGALGLGVLVLMIVGAIAETATAPTYYSPYYP